MKLSALCSISFFSFLFRNDVPRLACQVPAVDADELPRLSRPFLPVFYHRRGFCIIILHHHIRTFPDSFMLLYQIGQVCSKYVMAVKYDTVSWALCGFFFLWLSHHS